MWIKNRGRVGAGETCCARRRGDWRRALRGDPSIGLGFVTLAERLGVELGEDGYAGDVLRRRRVLRGDCYAGDWEPSSMADALDLMRQTH